MMNHLWVWHVIRAGILRQTIQIANATDAFLLVSRGFPRFLSGQSHAGGNTPFFPAGLFLFAGRKVT
ncbi:hypothetical protein BS412_09490 [Cronobacter turicensis]|uniref:Uncharacterized protein n=1 Tax=Cronobacter turicensis TaxID=413502 RepID=A0A2T7B2R2_9ENTR|nr:hypothetical protein BS411_15780 [Cronobacter turicensis]PUX36954.1 hypothetical protein BS412_09490 [Cronobacter turicensis]